MTYSPSAPPLILDQAPSTIRACVIVPARNEERNLLYTLDALRLQQDLNCLSLAFDCYEVILLLNNCTDNSQSVAEEYRGTHLSFNLHVIARTFPPQDAHIGTARRLLMDTAWSRLKDSNLLHTAILSTDADTLVAPDWIARNLAAIEAGADAVGGVIDLFPDDLDALKRTEPGTYHAYQRDRRFQCLVARLESILDPDPADPWPRHLEHFGASVACTPASYALAGGLPAVEHLEDAALIDALRKVGARIRHCPNTHVFTSARTDGRTQVGLSGQLKMWKVQSRNNETHLVDSAQWLEHRFRSIAALRRLNRCDGVVSLSHYPEPWRCRIAALRDKRLPTPQFLQLLDCNSLIEETFTHARRAEIMETISALTTTLCGLEQTMHGVQDSAIQEIAV